MNEPIVVTVDASISDLIPLFLQQRHADLADLARALDDADSLLIRRAAHAIAGASASYGFEELTLLGERLAVAGRAGDFAQARALKLEIASYLSRLVVKSS